MKKNLWYSIGFIICSSVLFVQAQAEESTFVDDDQAAELWDLGLEELANLRVYSVSKKQESLMTAPAAVHVLTSEDIRRSGATCIPEVLRLVPGLQVSQINANSWAITCRGFQNQFANKLLVLIDGRSVYNTQYSGVYWDVQDVILEDVERIEVVRGPGGALWGANAVNGIINIITKDASETQGTLIVAGKGTQDRGFGTVRYGGQLGEQAHYRLYLKYKDIKSSFQNTDSFTTLPQGAPNNPSPNPQNASFNDLGDDWNTCHSGGRLDWDKTDQDHITLSAHGYYGNVDQSSSRISLPFTFEGDYGETTQVSGGHVLGRWSHTQSESSDTSLQLYCNRLRRAQSNATQTDDTLDLDFQHRWALTQRHELVWGLGYRFNSNLSNNEGVVTFSPKRRDTQLFSSFIQDEIQLIQDRLSLIVGSKLEHNDYTGVELQPSVRMSWTPRSNHNVWGAISRAVRTPSRADNDLRVRAGSASLSGSDQFESETVIAYELGYRTQVTEKVTLDVATFYNDYDELRSKEHSDGTDPLDLYYDNLLSGETYGVEIATHVQPTEAWTLSTGYSFARIQLHCDSESGDTSSEQMEGNSPHNQVFVQSRHNLSNRLQCDALVFYVDNLPLMNIPAYTRLDLRLGYQVSDQLELSFIGQNLLDPKHLEFNSEENNSDTSGIIERALIARLTYRF